MASKLDVTNKQQSMIQNIDTIQSEYKDVINNMCY